jgi:UDP-N-acetylglucosamine 2-epimerase (non-hydrolysing)
MVKKIVLVAGARPNFMKVAPVLKALELAGARTVLVHTGQHYDSAMSGTFLEELELRPPDANLGVGSGSHAEQTAKVMMAFEPVCLAEKPDWVVVVGDVNSTLACALVARKLGAGVAHVEAGLRSGDMTMPEEVNRICTDALSDLLFTTEEAGNRNLRREGVAAGRIHFVGNTMIDSLMNHMQRARDLPLPAGLSAGQYAVLTLHRPANVDDEERLRGLLAALEVVAERMPVVFPAHPRTRKRLAEFGLALNGGRWRVVEPMGYLAFLGLVAQSRMVLTDSGGIQEETTALGVPCLTLRDNTERPVTCDIGTNILVGTSPERVRTEARRSIEAGNGHPRTAPELWDGRAGERIAEILKNAHPVFC